MFKEYTLVYPTDDNGMKILLGMQNSGLWHSFYNGFGGKVKPEETPDRCILRELNEELDVEITAYNLYKFDKLAEVSFYESSALECYSKVHVYSIDIKYLEGDPKGIVSDLKWFSMVDKRGIPYNMMPPTDVYWLPHVLHYHNNPLGKKMYINVDISLDKNEIISSVKFSNRLYEGFMGDI